VAAAYKVSGLHTHPLSHLQLCHVRPQRGYLSGQLVPGQEGRGEAWLRLTTVAVQITPADAGCLHAHQNLSGSGNRRFNLFYTNVCTAIEQRSTHFHSPRMVPEHI
jgi:hypothetical protein